MAEAMSDARLAELRAMVKTILPGTRAQDVRALLSELLDEVDRLRKERDEDVRTVDAYLIAAAVGGEQAAVSGDPFLRLRGYFIERIADLAVRDREAAMAAHDPIEHPQG